MHLKSLEIQGFKSFPDKTTIQFGSDITAIVGPNGSGKSNISDAIRWVMGEQNTKTLRGAKMEDVIFGGTQKRTAVGFAEATLTLDNSDRALAYDADEVMVTRRYYRPGRASITSTSSPPVCGTSTSCSWTPAWAGRAIPTSARAALTRFWR